MTVESAFEILQNRMNDLGFCKNYYPELIHLVLQPGETVERNAYNQLWILVDEIDSVNVSSDFGVFDLSLKNANELKYEHQGKIKIKNYASAIVHLRFAMGIMKHKTTSDAKQQQT
ncbi:MAG: hypothetical protein HY063_10965 [Bacteroidetes bacterium]|nr:hypothetical protein [Bacteroidota bacterium]